jgi:hypothetical protein
MPESEERIDADRPEPEDALSGAGARTADHQPTDSDDRDVELDEPVLRETPIDDETDARGPAPAA